MIVILIHGDNFKILAILCDSLDDQTQVDSKPAGQPEHASLNQRQIIAQNLCPAEDGDQVSL